MTATTAMGPASDPYITPELSSVGGVLDITLIVSEQLVDIGGGITAKMETINETIPGPTLRLNVNDTVIVRLVNDLPFNESSFHWHGIELGNSADGTPVTQDGAAIGPFALPVPPGTASPSGGTYLYKFKVPRPGLYWYHPHHSQSTNRVFRGTYGMIIVTDPKENELVEGDPVVVAPVLPSAANTVQLVLSDVTVCKVPLSVDPATTNPNDPATYVDPTDLILFPDPLDAPEWMSGATSQLGPTPIALCETSPLTDAGVAGGPEFASGDVPNIQIDGGGRTVEGQTVLTNGVNVGGRLGTPTTPRALDAAAVTYAVESGQGLRLQIVNCATTRYFRLILTSQSGKVDLIRVGGQGGLLNSAVKEGGLSGRKTSTPSTRTGRSCCRRPVERTSSWPSQPEKLSAMC